MEDSTLTQFEGTINQDILEDVYRRLSTNSLDVLMSASLNAHCEGLTGFIYEMSDPFHPETTDGEDDTEMTVLPEPEYSQAAALAIEKGMLVGLTLGRPAFSEYANFLGLAEFRVRDILRDQFDSEIAEGRFHLGWADVIAKTGLDFYKSFKDLDLYIEEVLDQIVAHETHLDDYVRSGIGLMLLLFATSRKLYEEEAERLEVDAQFLALTSGLSIESE